MLAFVGSVTTSVTLSSVAGGVPSWVHELVPARAVPPIPNQARTATVNQNPTRALMSLPLFPVDERRDCRSPACLGKSLFDLEERPSRKRASFRGGRNRGPA